MPCAATHQLNQHLAQVDLQVSRDNYHESLMLEFSNTLSMGGRIHIGSAAYSLTDVIDRMLEDESIEDELLDLALAKHDALANLNRHIEKGINSLSAHLASERIKYEEFNA